MTDTTRAIDEAARAQAAMPQTTDAEKGAANDRAVEVFRAALGIDEEEAAIQRRLVAVGVTPTQRS